MTPSKHSLVSWILLLLFFFFFFRGWGGGVVVRMFFNIFCFVFVFVLDGKSVMSVFCSVMLLLYVHVCVTRTGWKTRPRPKTVILLIKQSINQSISLSLSLSLSLPPPLPPLSPSLSPMSFSPFPFLVFLHTLNACDTNGIPHMVSRATWHDIWMRKTVQPPPPPPPPLPLSLSFSLFCFSAHTECVRHQWNSTHGFQSHVA